MRILMSILLVFALSVSFAQAAPLNATNCETSLRAGQAVEADRSDFMARYVAIVAQTAPTIERLMDSQKYKFGYESEFTLDKYATNLLKYYSPTQSNLGSADWEALGQQENGQVEWVRDHLDQLFTSLREQGALALNSSDPKLSFLPERLILDYSGNLEMILAPQSPLRAWQTSTRTIAKLIGNGSLQGTIGTPWNKFWQKLNGDPRPVLGMLQFFSDLDALLKLNVGYQKGLKEPNRQTAAAFSHPFLGPLTQLKRTQLSKYLNANAKGKMLDEQAHEFVSHNDSSWKFTGSTVYRPDIGSPDWLVFEVRDAHSNLDLLNSQMHRLLFFLENGVESFATFADVPAFDSSEDYAKLPGSVQALLKRSFPMRFIAEREEYAADELLANEVFRNFAFPLRDWNSWLVAMDQSNAKGRVELAQRSYIMKLSDIEARASDGKLTDEQVKVEIEFALAEFSATSGLLDLFLEQLQMLIQMRLETAATAA